MMEETRSGKHGWLCGAVAGSLLVLVLSWTGTLVAQESPPALAEANLPASAPPETEPATAPASTPATGPATAPATEPATEPTTEPAVPRPVFVDGKLLLNFQDASLRAVLSYLSEAAGFIIIGDIPQVRINVMSRQPITIDQAVLLIDTVLKDKGYVAVRGVNRTLQVFTSEGGRRAAGTPVRVGGDPNKIEPTDRVVTQIIPIRTVDASKLKVDLANLVPSNTDVAFNALSNTLIITGPESVIRRLAEIIRGIDNQMPDASVVRVFQLKYASASGLARLIQDIFREDATAGGAAGGAFGGAGRRVFGGGGAGGGPGGGRISFGPGGIVIGGAGDAGDAGTRRAARVTASADDRTNTLVVSASEAAMKVIEDVVRELDSMPPDQIPSVFVYRLKNAQAANVAAVLNSSFGVSGGAVGGGTGVRQTTGTTGFGATGAGATGGRGVGLGTGGRGGAAGGGASGLGLGTGFGATGTGGTTGGRGTTGGFGFGTGGRGGTGSSVAGLSDLAGQVYVVPDSDTNSLLVTAAPKNWDRIRAIIDTLDRPVPQVLIKVLLAEVTHDNSLDLGVEFAGMNLRGGEVTHGLGVGKEIPYTGSPPRPPLAERGLGFSPGSNFQVAGQLGRTDIAHGFAFQLSERYVTAAIRAIASKTTLNVLSRPYILTGDNQQASIMVGEQVPIITSSNISPDTLQTINSYTYINVGIILNVTPHINPQGVVTLDVAPTISQRQPKGQGVPIQAGIEAPAFTMRSASCRVAIGDGQTIVIGGLMQDVNTESVDKVPLLGDIPWLGALFQHRETRKTKTELLIFLTPHVAQMPEELKSMSEDEQSGATITRDADSKGLLKEHLEGMKRGAASRPAEEE